MTDTVIALLPKRWNYWVLSSVFIAALIFQYSTLRVVCHCWEGAWDLSQCNAAFVFDGLVIGRIAVSFVLRERNQKWIVWAVMCALSPLWISWIFELARALLGPRYGI